MFAAVRYFSGTLATPGIRLPVDLKAIDVAAGAGDVDLPPAAAIGQIAQPNRLVLVGANVGQTARLLPNTGEPGQDRLVPGRAPQPNQMTYCEMKSWLRSQ